MTLKVALSDDLVSKPFSFTSNCKDLEGAIQKGVATLSSSPSGTKNFILVATKSGKVYLAALGGDTFVVLRVLNAKAESSGAFGFESEKLLGIIKGRSVMEFSYTKTNECEFKLVKGKYSGKITTLPITADTVSLFNSTFSPKEKDSKSAATADISPELLDILREGLAVTAVKDVFNGNSMLSYIAFTKGSVSISTYDTHHFGYYEAKAPYKGKEFLIASPMTHFQLVDKLVSGFGDAKESVTFSMHKETLRIMSESFIAVLPMMQADEKSFALIPGFLKDLGKVDFRCGLDSEELATVIENLFTLHSVNTSFDFAFKEGSDLLKVTFTSGSDTASDSLKVSPGKSKSISAKVEPKVFKDVVGLARLLKETSFSVKKDKCILIKASTKLDATVTYVCSLL